MVTTASVRYEWHKATGTKDATPKTQPLLYHLSSLTHSSNLHGAHLMYVQDPFAEHRHDEIFSLVGKHPLGAIITTRTTEIEVDHLPFSVHSDIGSHGTLRCHVARGNPLWRALADNNSVVTVFQGPNAYISPTWMPNRKRHGKVAPSWNYVAVHAYGIAHVTEDAAWLKQHLRDLISAQENHRPDRWSLDEAPEEFVAQLLNNIVGIEITVNRLVGKWFVSQYRSPSDREGVVAGLLQEQTDATTAVAAMIKAYAPAAK